MDKIEVGQRVFWYDPNVGVRGIFTAVQVNVDDRLAVIRADNGPAYHAKFEYLSDATGKVHFRELEAGDVFRDDKDQTWVRMVTDCGLNAVRVDWPGLGGRVGFHAEAAVKPLTKYGEVLPAKLDPGELPKLIEGQEVYWRDPDNGTCSGQYVVVEIMFDDVDDDGELKEDTVVRLRSFAGSEAEVYLREIEPVGRAFTIIGMYCGNWQGHCELIIAASAEQAVEIYHKYGASNQLQAMGVIEGDHVADWLTNQ